MITGIQDLEFTVTDVVEGKEYLFRVTACNKCGPGEPAYIDEPVNVSSPASEPEHLYNQICCLLVRYRFMMMGILRIMLTRLELMLLLPL